MSNWKKGKPTECGDYDVIVKVGGSHYHYRRRLYQDMCWGDDAVLWIDENIPKMSCEQVKLIVDSMETITRSEVQEMIEEKIKEVPVYYIQTDMSKPYPPSTEELDACDTIAQIVGKTDMVSVAEWMEEAKRDNDDLDNKIKEVSFQNRVKDGMIYNLEKRVNSQKDVIRAMEAERSELNARVVDLNQDLEYAYSGMKYIVSGGWMQPGTISQEMEFRQTVASTMHNLLQSGKISMSDFLAIYKAL